MGMTLQQAMDRARGILSDRDSTKRYSDADLLDYGNAALQSLAESPAGAEFFSVCGEVECAAGKTLQEIAMSDAVGLAQVLGVKNGSVVTMCERGILDRFSSGWRFSTAGAAVHYMPVPSSPRQFEIYPPAPSGQVLQVMYIRRPPAYAAGDDTGLPASVIDDVAAYIVGMAEVRDDEHAVSGRAQFFLGAGRAAKRAAPSNQNTKEQ